MGLRRAAIALAVALIHVLPSRADNALEWRSWTADVFAKAKAENRLVLLDLEVVWCHVMEGTTYRDPKVADLLKSKFLTVRVDQDAHPDLSNRYGNWGWPATILFAPDGTELAKLRGYIPPERMAPLLQAFIDDPTPGPSAAKEIEITPATSPFLTSEQRAGLLDRNGKAYDEANGGWGEIHKFIDTDSMDWSLTLAGKGDAEPRIDRNIYARENGWAISGLAAYYNITNDPEVLERAERAARYMLVHRRIDGSGFRHSGKDRAGPYLGDTLAMGQAALDLYTATGKREWLQIAGEAGDFIGNSFLDPSGGFLTSKTPESTPRAAS